MEKKNSRSRNIKAGLAIGTIVLVVSVFSGVNNFLVDNQYLIYSHMNDNILDDYGLFDMPIQEERVRSWKEFLLPLGDADPGSGNSGVLVAGIAKSGVTWTSNLTYGTDTWCITETNDTHAGDNVPYDTNVYVFAKLRLNRSDIMDYATVDEYKLEYVSGWLNCTGLGASAVEMSEANVSGCNAGEFVWVHFYSGPYTWQRGQNITGINMKWRIYN